MSDRNSSPCCFPKLLATNWQNDKYKSSSHRTGGGPDKDLYYIVLFATLSCHLQCASQSLVNFFWIFVRSFSFMSLIRKPLWSHLLYLDLSQRSWPGHVLEDTCLLMLCRSKNIRLTSYHWGSSLPLDTHCLSKSFHFKRLQNGSYSSSPSFWWPICDIGCPPPLLCLWYKIGLWHDHEGAGQRSQSLCGQILCGLGGGFLLSPKPVVKMDKLRSTCTAYFTWNGVVNKAKLT